jgi:hypothetical protein
MTAETSIGERLFATVERYTGVAEHHRSGTPEGDATTGWFADELRALGAHVELLPYEFERFDVRWEVRLDGEAVPSLPYYYAGRGRVKTDHVLTGTLEVRPPAEMPAHYAALEARAREVGAVATVTATLAPCGELFAHNSAVREPGPMPHLGVAGKFAERLQSARVEVDFDASVVPGKAVNVVAELGDGDPAQAVLLATPLSAWFRSAGERGSGIALCLEVARQLAQVAPVRVVGTTCHELGHDGLLAYFAAGVPPCRGVIHFGGSSVTIIPGEDGQPMLNPRFAVRGWLGDEHRGDFERIYGPLDRVLLSPPDAEHRTWPRWMGEATEWASLGVPLVSHSGRGPYTHTDHDLPHLATASGPLRDVFACDLRVARLMAGVPA